MEALVAVLMVVEQVLHLRNEVVQGRNETSTHGRLVVLRCVRGRPCSQAADNDRMQRTTRGALGVQGAQGVQGRPEADVAS